MLNICSLKYSKDAISLGAALKGPFFIPHDGEQQGVFSYLAKKAHPGSMRLKLFSYVNLGFFSSSLWRDEYMLLVVECCGFGIWLEREKWQTARAVRC